MINRKFHTVRDKDTARKMFDHIKESSIIAVDTETNSLEPQTGKIIGFSVSGEVGVGFYIPTLEYSYSTDSLQECSIEGTSAHDVAVMLLKSLKGKKLVFHNGSFDIRFINNFYKVNLLDDLYCDTVLLVHTVREEGAFGFGNPFGLKSIAKMVQEEIGLDIDSEANEEQLELKASIVSNGGSVTKDNYEIFKADMEILSKYACADTDLTLRLYYHFSEILEDEDLGKFFYEDEVMPIYREVTIPMEMYGIKLDVDYMKATREAITEDMIDLRAKVIKTLMDTDEAKLWAMNKALEEFPPKQKGRWGNKLCDLYGLNLPVSEKTGKYSLSKKNIEVLPDSKYKTFLLEGESSVLDKFEILKVSLELCKDKNEGEYININSKKHLSEVVFNYMGVEPLSKTDKGAPQFNDNMVKELSNSMEWANKLRVFNKLTKIRSTYIDRFLEGRVGDRFYPYFKQHGTVTGRYGSDLQQLPRPIEDPQEGDLIAEYTNRIRGFFIADEGYHFIDADYESLEPHIFASVSNDEGLQEIFQKGHDFYSTVAIRTENLKDVSADKKASNYLKKVDAGKRQTAKAYALGLAYGMSAYALAQTLEVSQKEAKRLVDGYMSGFPGVSSWIEESHKFFHENGYVKNMVGRVRHLNDGFNVYSRYGSDIMNWGFRKDLEEVHGEELVTKWYRDYKNARNSSQNFQIQSLAASVVNRAALAINREFKKRGWDAIVVAQIHDQLVVHANDNVLEQAASLVQHLMETTTKLRGVTLKSPPEISSNLRDGH